MDQREAGDTKKGREGVSKYVEESNCWFMEVAGRDWGTG